MSQNLKFVVRKTENIVGKAENAVRKTENIVGKAENAVRKTENIVGKAENAGYQHFLLFQQYFQEVSLSVIKSPDCGIHG